MYVIIIIAITSGIGLLLLLFTLKYIRRYRKPIGNMNAKLKVCIVCGPGGHTAEMLRLVAHLGEKYAERYYLIAEKDWLTEGKVIELEARRTDGHFRIFFVSHCGRSVGVRQSCCTRIFNTIKATFVSFPIVFRLRPDLVLCNGPGICIPVCLAAYLLDLFLVISVKIVFIESICRVKNLSLSGWNLYYLRIPDKFLVQWPQLTTRYKRANYIGRLL